MTNPIRCSCGHLSCNTTIAADGIDNLGSNVRVRLTISSDVASTSKECWLTHWQLSELRKQIDALMASPEGVAP